MNFIRSDADPDFLRVGSGSSQSQSGSATLPIDSGCWKVVRPPPGFLLIFKWEFIRLNKSTIQRKSCIRGVHKICYWGGGLRILEMSTFFPDFSGDLLD